MRDLVELILGEDEADADDTVLDAALSAFLDFGIRRSSMADVARRAKVSPATLYRRYPGKDALVSAVLVRDARRLVAGVDRQVDKSAGAEDQLVEGFVAMLDEVSSNRLFRRLLETEPDIVLPQIFSAGGIVLAVGRMYLADNIRQLQDAGSLPDFDADEVAEILARLAATLAFVPEGVIPLRGDEARAFAREHLTRLVRLR